MRNMILCLAGILALTACGPDSRVSEAPDGYPALWEVSRADGRLEGWLFGTVHALPDDVEWKSPKLNQVVREADTLVVEVANLDDGANLSRLFSGMAFDGTPGPLRQRIAPELRGDYDDLLERARIRQGSLDTMESWAAALSLAQAVQVGKPENGVDRALMAEFEDREILELEGASKQLAIFDGLPERDQRDLLDAVLREGAQLEDRRSRIVEVWRSGKLEEMAKLADEGVLSDRELRQALLVDRNDAWAARLARLFPVKDRLLVAVGAGHLLGPDGLPEQLRQAGYVVRRIE